MESTRSELHRLISRAVSSALVDVELRTATQDKVLLTPLQYRAHFPDTASGYDRVIRRAEPLVEQHHNQALAEYLMSLSALDKYFDSTRQFLTCDYSVGFSISVGMPIEKFVDKVVMSAIVHTEAKVVEVLQTFFESDAVPMQLIFFLAGTRIAESVSLDESSRLVTWEELKSLTAPLEDFVAGPDLNRINGAGCGLIVEASVTPGTWDAAHSTRAIPKLAGLARDDIGVLCYLLSLITQREFYPFAQTSVVAPVIFDTLPSINHLPISGWSIHNFLTPIFSSDFILPYLDTSELRSLAENFGDCSLDVKRHLWVPLSRFQSATSRLKLEDRFIDLATAFESLLDVGNSSQVTRTLAKRASWLYAETVEEKDQSYERMTSFYTLRSEIVHNGLQVNEKDYEIYSQAQSIFIICLKNIIRKQSLVDWSSRDYVVKPFYSPGKDPSEVLSDKHISTSWSIGELPLIDESLSKCWLSTLQGKAPNANPTGVHQTEDLATAIADLEARNESFVLIDPTKLRDAHPNWPMSFGEGDKAHQWQCGEDIRRHVKLWIEEAIERRLTAVYNPTDEFLKNHRI